MKILEGLKAQAFQHPMDAKLLRSIKGVPLMPRLVEKAVDYIARGQELEFYQGGAVEASERVMPELYARFESVCRTLDLPEPLPRLFVKADAAINAFTTGKERKIVCINRGVADFCTEGEQRFILGHEIGHCMCGHVVYHNVAALLAQGAINLIAYAPLQLLRPLLMDWSRCSELSADRAGLLACQNMADAASAFAKMSGHAYGMAGNMEEVLLEQAKGYRRTFGEYGLFRRLVKSLGYAFTATHPFIPLRFEWMKDWHDGGMFKELLDATYAERREIAAMLDGDPAMLDLKNAVLYETVDYLEERRSIARSVSTPLLRKALFLKESLAGTALKDLLQVELRVGRDGLGGMRYMLELILAKEGDCASATRVSIDVGYVFGKDWAAAPKQFRNEILRSRSDEIACAIYSA